LGESTVIDILVIRVNGGEVIDMAETKQFGRLMSRLGVARTVKVDGQDLPVGPYAKTEPLSKDRVKFPLPGGVYFVPDVEANKAAAPAATTPAETPPSGRVGAPATAPVAARSVPPGDFKSRVQVKPDADSE
jgi:hypothetical protein